MGRSYSLAYLTSFPLDAPEAIELAARLGYDAIGLRIAPANPGGEFTALITDHAMRRRTLAVLKSAGIRCADIEIVRVGEAFDATAWLPFLETCAELGARHVLVAGDDPDEQRLTASYAAFCEAARPFNLTADLEAMPWTKVPNIAAATRIAVASGQANAGVLVDAIHVERSASPLADIAAIPRNLLNYWQICDAPAGIPSTVKEMIRQAREERLLPGEGGIDLAGIIQALPATLTVSVEVPHEEWKQMRSIDAWATAALAAARALHDGAV